jgi:hypothetical protein
VRNSGNDDDDIRMSQVFILTDPELRILYPDDGCGDIHEMSQRQITVDVQQDDLVCQAFERKRVGGARPQCASTPDDRNLHVISLLRIRESMKPIL